MSDESGFSQDPSSSEQTRDEPPDGRQRGHVGWSRRRTSIVLAAVLAVVVVVGAGAYAAANWLFGSSVNPAERLPDSVAMYMELNLDPSLDQTPKLLQLANRLELLDEDTDTETLLADLMAELDGDLGGVDVDGDVASWLGSRGASAMWAGSSGEPYLVLALASTDDAAAEAGLSRVRDAADVDFGFTVDDGLALLLIGEGNPDLRMPQLMAEAAESPLASSAEFVDALDRLVGDQLVIGWFDDGRMEDVLSGVLRPEEIEQARAGSLFPAGESMAFGLRAVDDGLELRYATDQAGELATIPHWQDAFGQLPAAQLAGMVRLPENLGEFVEPMLEAVEQFASDASPISPFGGWDYDLALTDDEFNEYEDLSERARNGELDTTSAEADRLLELENRWWFHGLRRDYDDWVTAGGESVEQWNLENALTEDEFALLEDLDARFSSGLDESEEQLLTELNGRLLRHGVVTDYETADTVDLSEVITEAAELLAGSTLSLALGDVEADVPAVDFTLDLVDGDGAELLSLAEGLEVPVPDEIVVDGSRLELESLPAAAESIADDERFETVFADAPAEALLAVYVDLAALVDASNDESLPEALDVFGWVQGIEDGNHVGVMRLLLK